MMTVRRDAGMPTLEELRARFRSDCFATQALGAEIREAEPACARST